MTGEDRFLEAAEGGVEYLREHLRNVDSGEGVDLLVSRHRDQRAEREEDPRLGVRRRLPGHPGLRADLRPGRPGPDLPDHRRPAHPGRHRPDDLAVRAVLLRPELRRLLVAPRPDLVRRQERRAGPQPGAQELELGRRPHPGLPDQHLAGDRRGQVRRHARRDRGHHRAALPRRREQPVRPGAVPRGLEPRRDVGLAAEPRGRRAQPQDRLEPDAHPPHAPGQPLPRAGQQDQRDDARGRQRPAARRLVRRRRAGARARAGGDPLHLARPQGLVAAGAGHPRLPDHGRLDRQRRGAPARARGGRVLQRLVLRLRRGLGLLQRPGQRHPLPARHRAAEGQPLDGRLPLVRAGLPGHGLHQPADHQGADGPVVQPDPGRPQGQHPAGLAGHPAARAASGSARSRWTASRTPTSTPTG